MADPRKAKTLDEAARNEDGSYNGVKALSWLSEVLCPGNGLTESEVVQLAEEAKHEQRRKCDSESHLVVAARKASRQLIDAGMPRVNEANDAVRIRTMVGRRAGHGKA